MFHQQQQNSKKGKKSKLLVTSPILIRETKNEIITITSRNNIGNEYTERTKTIETHAEYIKKGDKILLKNYSGIIQ